MDEISRHLIGFENGVYDIHKKVFRKGRKDDFVSISTGYKYYDFNKQFENEKINECYNIFRSLFRTDEYTRHFVKRLAFMMDGAKTRQEFDFFIGAGGNGKSLISEAIIAKVFGDYSTVMSSNYLMTADKDSNRATPELAQAKGARFLFVSEPDTNNGSKMQTNKIKLMSGTDRIPCRFLRENPIKYIPQFSLIFLVNDFPELSSIDGGILRRPVITEFPFLFRKKEDIPDFGTNPDVKEIDMNLGGKCEVLKLFFFKLFVENYDKEYAIIEDVKKSTEEYKKIVDPIGYWIKDYFVPSTNDKDNIKVKDFVDCYNIEKEAKVNSKDVVKSIIALGYTKKLSNGVTVINKIKLKEGVEDIFKKYLLDYKDYTVCKKSQDINEVVNEST
jgi:P4 family phage/plasmid primase-like protien